MLEQGQRVRQHQRLTEAIDLQAQRAGLRAIPLVQRQGQRRLRRQAGELAHIRQRIARGNLVAVVDGEGGAPGLEQGQSRGLAFGVDQGVAQLVVPAACRRGQLALDVLALERGHLARRRTNRELDSRQRRVAQQDVEFGMGAVQRRQQDVLELDAADRWNTPRAARTPGTRRTCRTGRATRTASAAGARPGPGCPMPSRTGPRPVSGTGRRADRSPGCGPAPWPGGRPAASRRAWRSPRPCRATAASRKPGRCRRWK